MTLTTFFTIHIIPLILIALVDTNISFGLLMSLTIKITGMSAFTLISFVYMWMRCKRNYILLYIFRNMMF